MIRRIRIIFATILMMFASLLKITTVAVAPADLKKEFQDNI